MRVELSLARVSNNIIFTLRAQSVHFAHACPRKRTGIRHFVHAVLKNNVRPSLRSGDKPTLVPKSFLSHLYRK